MNKSPAEYSTHRIIQLYTLKHNLMSDAMTWRERAIKAASIGNRSAAIYFTGKAIKCDSILKYRLANI